MARVCRESEREIKKERARWCGLFLLPETYKVQVSRDVFSLRMPPSLGAHYYSLPSELSQKGAKLGPISWYESWYESIY